MNGENILQKLLMLILKLFPHIFNFSFVPFQIVERRSCLHFNLKYIFKYEILRKFFPFLKKLELNDGQIYWIHKIGQYLCNIFAVFAFSVISPVSLTQKIVSSNIDWGTSFNKSKCDVDFLIIFCAKKITFHVVRLCIKSQSRLILVVIVGLFFHSYCVSGIYSFHFDVETSYWNGELFPYSC